MMPPVTLVPGSRADTASGSGDSGPRVLDKVIMMGVMLRDDLCLPEAFMIWKESVPSVVDLNASNICLHQTCTDNMTLREDM